MSAGNIATFSEHYRSSLKRVGRRIRTENLHRTVGTAVGDHNHFELIGRKRLLSQALQASHKRLSAVVRGHDDRDLYRGIAHIDHWTGFTALSSSETSKLGSR